MDLRSLSLPGGGRSKAPRDLDPTGEGMAYDSNKDPYGRRARHGAGAQADGSASEPGELRGLLSRIADHMANAGQRQDTALRNVQSRLVNISGETQTMRPVSPDFAAAFARIENGITELAGSRFASSESGAAAIERATEGWRPGEPATQRQSFWPEDADFPFDDRLRREYEPDMGRAESRHASDAPQPRPAAAPSGFDDWADEGRHFAHAAQSAPHHAPYPQPADHDNQWDYASADALARLYEPERSDAYDDDFAFRHAQIPEQSEPQAPFSEPSTYREPARPAAHDAATESVDRIAGIADRLEHVLASIRPDGSVAALEARFDNFEHKVGTALADITVRLDADRLNAVAAHIGELVQHVSRTQNQLGRLDEIETQLTLLGEQISDQRFTQLMDQRQMPEVDVSRLADVVVERLWERQVRDGEVGAARDRLSELGNVIEQFVASQRKGGEHIAGALATIQHSLRNLLARMDKLELAQSSVAAPATGQYGTANAAGRSAHGGAREGEEVQAYQFQDSPTFGATPGPTASSGDFAGGRASSLEEAMAYRLDEIRQARPAMNDSAFPPDAARVSGQGNAGPGSSGSADGARPMHPSREDFLAAARRAARKAASQGGDEPAEFVRSNSRAGSAPAGKRIPGSRPVTGLVVATLGVVLAVGIGLTTYSIYKGTVKRPAGLERSAVKPAAKLSEVPGAASEEARGIVIDNGTAPTSVLPMPVALIPQSSDHHLLAMPPKGADASAGNRNLPPAEVGPLPLRIAAANGDPSAEYEVAVRLADGQGIKQDLNEAVTWYQRSAARGFAPAQYRLGTMYERGLGVGQDLGRATAWYRSAAEKGNLKAMHNLAVLNASSSAADYQAAARWFTVAASHGLTDSQYNLAVLYETGRGIDLDLTQAYIWFSLAAIAGDTEAARRRDAVKAKLDPAQLRSADAAIRSWKPLTASASANDPRAAGTAWNDRQG